MTERCRVIIMAKAPAPGYAKTRLIPGLGAERAAALAARLLDRAVDEALRADVGPVELCCAPDHRQPAFTRHAGTPGLQLSDQCAGDLGARMAAAFAQAAPGDGAALLMGTDAPALDALMLRGAARALAAQDVDAVFVPALDGGYALIGLRRPAPSLFDEIAWSTPSVMAQTRIRLALAGLRHVELPPIADIDEAADLAHLPSGWLP